MERDALEIAVITVASGKHMVAHVGTIKCICGLEVDFGERVGDLGLGGVVGGRGGVRPPAMEKKETEHLQQQQKRLTLSLQHQPKRFNYHVKKNKSYKNNLQRRDQSATNL